jgi:large subunit ribosomal protein L24
MAGIKSSKPKKQRKAHYEKALHKKQQGLAAHLDKKLRKDLGKRSVSLRKGDSVKVLRGAKKGKSGKITAINYKKGTVFVDKLVRKKANGEEIPLPVQASNLLVLDVDRSDAKRFRGKEKVKEKRKEKEVSKEGKALKQEKSGKEKKEAAKEGKGKKGKGPEGQVEKGKKV